FIIETLEFLHKGGRCSTLAAMGANILKLRPEIVFDNGSMRVGKKYRGSFEACTRAYITDRLGGRTDLDLRRVFITHSGSSPEIVEAVRKQLNDLGYFKEILETRAGSVISSHCGPGTLGVLFIAGDAYK
ncbi:MAG: DegV family protein, partial [Lachnospiraceae bacterium]|nr:DegV family protein [Lachnospiraceae bacterium]